MTPVSVPEWSFPNKAGQVYAGNICFFFLFFEKPNLFAICNNTFSKWWEG
jgi:hypothetical protein